jgi:hypothetical protein
MDGLQPIIHATEFKYDFAVHGGAIGAVTIQDKTIPRNALILGALIIDPDTNIAGGSGATVALGVITAGDLHAADAFADINGGPLWADQLVIGETAPIETASEEGLIVTIATAALTAGIFRVKVFWVHG